MIDATFYTANTHCVALVTIDAISIVLVKTNRTNGRDSCMFYSGSYNDAGRTLKCLLLSVHIADECNDATVLCIKLLQELLILDLHRKDGPFFEAYRQPRVAKDVPSSRSYAADHASHM